MASYFTRGSGHDTHARYSERPADYKATVDRLAKKYQTAKQFVPQPVIDRRPDATIGFIAYGTTDVALEESRYQLRNEHGVETSYFRLRALPFTDELQGVRRSARPRLRRRAESRRADGRPAPPGSRAMTSTSCAKYCTTPVCPCDARLDHRLGAADGKTTGTRVVTNRPAAPKR